MIENFVPQPGMVFRDDEGPVTYAYMSKDRKTGETFAVVVRGDEQERMSYDSFVYHAQNSVPPPPNNTRRDFIRQTKLPFVDPLERQVAELMTGHMLQVIHGDKDGSIDGPRPEWVPDDDDPYNPYVTTSPHRRILTKVAELKRSPDPLVKQWTWQHWYKKVREFQTDGAECFIAADRLSSINALAAYGSKVLEIAKRLGEELSDPSMSRKPLKLRLAMFRVRLSTIEGLDVDALSDHDLQVPWEYATAGMNLEKPASVRNSQSIRPKGRLQGTYPATRPGEVAELDVATLDVYARSIVSKYITVDAISIIDIYDKYLMAVMLVPHPATARDLSFALFRALHVPIPAIRTPLTGRAFWHGAPGRIVLPSFEEIRAVTATGRRLPPRGISTARMDRGGNFTSYYLSEKLTRVGIHSQFTHPGQGNEKPHVEPWHGMLSAYAQAFPGAKGNNIVNRGKNPEHQAELSIADLERDISRRLAFDYNNRPHDGNVNPNDLRERESPTARYERFLQGGGSPSIMSRPNLIYDFLRNALVRFGEFGYRHGSVRYDDRNIWNLKDTRRGPTGPDIQIAWDDYDPTRIYFENPYTRRWDELLAYDLAVNSRVPFQDGIEAAAWAHHDLDLTFAKGDQSRVLAAIYGTQQRDGNGSKDSERSLALEFNRFVRSQHDRAELIVNPLAPEPTEEQWFQDPEALAREAVRELDDVAYEMDRTDGRPHWDMGQ